MKKNIVITGGELFNKGAQSMTFTVVDEMKKRYPDKDIYLFSSSDYAREDKEKRKYNFKILPYNIWTSFDIIYPFLKPIIKTDKIKRKDDIISVLKDAAFVIDISGYQFSSQFGAATGIAYLAKIKMFKKFKIPMYIFPQSMGPFKFKLPYNLYIKLNFKSTMSYPKKIFPREIHGYKLLNNYDLNNIEKNVDTVFYQDNLNVDNIYSEGEFELNLPKINENSVAIVPNSKLKRHNSDNSIDKLYIKIIEYLLEQNKEVYILRHSFEDLDFCKEIYKLKNNPRIHIFENDFNAIELYNLLPKFDYIIGSRYHSVVHAYKHNVPALVIGWAVKYKELTDAFDQRDYCFDIREKIDYDMLISKLDILNSNFEKDKIIIKDKLETILENNVFDAIIV